MYEVISCLDRGKVYTWGDNSDGHLGHSVAGGMCPTPTLVDSLDLLTAIEVRGGLSTTVILTGKSNSLSLCSQGPEEGSVYVCGSGEDGELGQGRLFHSSSVPLQVRGIDTKIFSSIASGGFHVLALTGTFHFNSYKTALLSNLRSSSEAVAFESFSSRFKEAIAHGRVLRH